MAVTAPGASISGKNHKNIILPVIAAKVVLFHDVRMLVWQDNRAFLLQKKEMTGTESTNWWSSLIIRHATKMLENTFLQKS